MTATLKVVDHVPQSSEPDALIVPLSSRIRRKRELFGVMKKHLRLPDMFSNNWDALHDALRDLSWLDGVKQVVLQHDGLPFAADSSHRATYLELLQGVMAEAPAQPAVTIVLPSAETQAVRQIGRHS